MSRRLVPALALLAACLYAVTASAAGDDPKALANHKITQNQSYIGLDPMYATILADGRPAGLLLVSIGLDVPNPILRAQVNTALPVLRDAYLRNLMAFTAAAVRPREQPDVDLIARRLQAVTNRELRQTGARVLLGQVFVRVTR